MKRWLFYIAAGMSLLLCIGSAVLWVIGSFNQNQLWNRADGTAVFHQVTLLKGGHIRFSRQTLLANRAPQGNKLYGSRPLWSRERLGISFSAHESYYGNSSTPIPSGRRYDIYVPLGLPAMLGAVLPSYWMVTFFRSTLNWRRSRRRIHQNLCVSCGYDLRAMPDRCPECGTIARRRNPFQTGPIPANA